MNTFVQIYSNKASTVFRSIPDGSFHTDSTTLHVAGYMEEAAWFGEFDADGNALWQYRYLLDERPTQFYRSVQCDNGDFILYGSHNTRPGAKATQTRNHHLVIRTDTKGKVKWAKTYFSESTRYDLDIVKSQDDTYIFTSWLNQKGSVDDIELIKIDGKGNVIKAVRSATKHDDQVRGIIPYGDGCILFGHTNAGANFDCFLAGFDRNLDITFSRLIGNKEYQTLGGLLDLGDDRFVLTGETGKERNTYVAELNLKASSIAAYLYDFKRDAETGPKILRRGPDGGFYLVSDMPSKQHLSFVMRFDSRYHIKWIRRFRVEGAHTLLDLQYEGDKRKDGLAICGITPAGGKLRNGLLAFTDANMNSCVTQDLPVPKPRTVDMAVKEWKLEMREHQVEEKAWKPKVQQIGVEARTLCSRGPDLDMKRALIQSPYIYLQTVGSTKADDSAAGFHLRWIFMRSLGDQHLPKGELAAPGGPYPTNIAFNRPNDFVRIYKTDFTPDFGITVDFVKPPSTVIEIGSARSWLYLDIASSTGLTTDVLLRFTNKVQYDFLRQTIDPLSDPQQFLSSYTATIELRPSGKMFFYLDVSMRERGGPNPGMRLETISLPDRLDPTTRQISSRRFLPAGTSNGLIGENWEYLRFDLNHAVPMRMYLIPYEDYISGIQARNGWAFWKDFSLDDGKGDGNMQVFNRLEEPGNYDIDRQWRKFNEPTADEFRVNVENYRKRWTMPDGVGEALVTYLDKSRIDPLANVQLPNADPQTNTSETEISYLLMLNFAGLDFHVARMLGFGAIDPGQGQQEGRRQVYLMQYHTSASLEGEPAHMVSHIYMAPPIATEDHRLPHQPEVLPVVYGLSADACGGTTSLTDTNGYAPFADVRFINLHRKPFIYELPFEPFYAHPQLFDLFRNTQTILFGVEYGPGGAGSGNWVRPEISHDTAWDDPGGLPEVRPVPDSGENPVYTHGETQTGIHHYGLYSINWFSRVSMVSNEVQTDLTVFDPRNTLLPPSNFMVQLVQKETPVILTSLSEQAMLASMGSGDKTLVRTTFNWNQVHNKAYQYANKAQFFFRVDPPLVVRGKVSSVTVNTFNHTALLNTTSYLQSSQPATVQPFIALGDAVRFNGSVLVVDGESFVIDAILTTGNNPQIRVKQIRQTASMDSLNENEFCTTEHFLSPEANKNFILVENLDRPANWDTQLIKEVTLTQFMPVHTETTVHSDGQSTTHFIGGLTGPATITHVFDTDPDLGPFIPAGGPPASQVPTGVYTLAFTAAVMPPHPEADVTYYQGTIRLRGISGDIRELQVWNINLGGVHPVLTLFDAAFALQRDAGGMFVITAGNFTPESVTDPVQTGAVPFANFHPGYRVYLHADLGSGHNFGEADILPGLDEVTKQTFMSIRSRASMPSLDSYMQTPSVLLAREIREPVPPGIPLGAVYATRPNFYGKATFTFDVQVTQPYSIIFYKANERRILDTLYDSDTVRDILAEMGGLSEADATFNQNRWSDLVNMVTDPGGSFMEYMPGGFRFPPPTNPDYVVPDPALPSNVKPFSLTNAVPPGSTATVPGAGRSWAAIVREAITGAFVPMTELPPVYSQIRNGTIQTSGRPPKVRDSNGKRIAPTSADYDPWPMIVRFERNAQDFVLVQGDVGYGSASNRRFVRFTDYTLDGAALNTYFYYSKELSNTLAVSAASPVIGPVKLVNAAPAEAPGIGRVNTMIRNSVLGTRDGVRFELNEYLPTENIRSIQLYRATDPDDALSIRTMQLVKTVDAGTDLSDTFEDLAFIPYGDPVFYKVIALRAIKNERGAEELVPSKPSNLVMASLIDNANPAPPPLAFASDPPIGSPLMLHNVILSFSPTCHNGTYILYKRSTGGHWIRIAERSGNDSIFYQPLLGTALATGTLAKQDGDLNYIYHQFKVVAMNSSGLLSRAESVLRI